MDNSEKITQLLRHRLEKDRRMLELVKQISLACDLISEALEGGRKLYALGNGGSAAQAEHLVTELMGRFKGLRNGLRAMALTTNTSLLTALANDFGYSEVFSRQVDTLVEAGDIVIGFSTSGRSPNVLKAMDTARRKRALTMAFTGSAGEPLVSACHLGLCMPADDTPLIQEMHQKVIHIICQVIDDQMSVNKRK